MVAPGPSSPSEALWARYRQCLVGRRGLSGPVPDAYRRWVAPFVEARLDAADLGFAKLAAEDVAGFLTVHLPAMTRKSAQMTRCALRSFLRFLHEEQILQADLADAVHADEAADGG